MLNLRGFFLFRGDNNGPAVYSKEALCIADQISLLKKRGVHVEDIAFAQQVLETVSYYRFSAYLYPFRDSSRTDRYIPGTSFNQCWQYYRFDRKLRFCIIDAIERIEVAVKTKIVNHLSIKYGPFAYRSPEIFAKPLNSFRYNELLKFIDTEIEKSREEFVRHFLENYDISQGLPLWMAVEVMTFGNMLTLFRLMKKKDKHIIAKSFGSNEHVFESWLANLNYIRNICAHHGRLWNRQLAVSPMIPKKDMKWYETDYPVKPNRIYSTLCILTNLMSLIAPQSQWKSRFISLLNDFPMIPRLSMAIPEDFEKSAIWR